jgi:hypothetical protein
LNAVFNLRCLGNLKEFLNRIRDYICICKARIRYPV